MFRRVAPVLVTLACLSTGAQAQPASLFRAYLSATGSDANPCTLAAPCRLLPAALNAVASGGEIWMLDSANYNTGTVTIGKSVSILSVPGAQGSIVANNASAILVGDAGLRVALRNVAVVPVAGSAVPGQFGLFLTGDSTVILERCLFAGLPDDAIRVTRGRLAMTDCVVRDSQAGWGVNVSSSIGAHASISGSQLLSNAEGGVRVSANAGVRIRASVTDTVIFGRSGTTDYGVLAVTTGAAQSRSQVMVSGGKIESTGIAISSRNAAAAIGVSGVRFMNNALVFERATDGLIVTFEDNIEFGNDNLSAGGLPAAVAKQ